MLDFSANKESGVMRSGLRALKSVLAIKLAPRNAPEEGADAVSLKQLVSLADLWHDCLYNLRLISLSVVVAVMLGILYLAIATPKYDISLRLMPIPEWLRSQPATQISSLFSTGQVDFFTLLGDAMQSKQIYERLDTALDARHHVFSSRWDPLNKTWHKPAGLAGIRTSVMGSLKGLVGYPHPLAPTIDDLRLNVFQRIEVQTNSDGTVTIEMKSADPAYDTRVLRFVLEQADAVVRAEMIKYAGETTQGLRSQIDATNESLLRSALIDRLATQLTLKAGLQNNRILALDMHGIEVSDIPMFPSFKGTLIVAFLIGLLFPVGLIFLLEILG